MKRVSIVLLLVAIMVLSMTGCGKAPAEVIDVAPVEVIERGELQFKAKGTYNVPGFGSEFVVHRFDAPNDDIVVYEMPGATYIVGENTDKIGARYVNVFVGDSQFVALSNKYILLAKGECMIAFTIVGSENAKNCTGLMEEISFDDLSEEEKDTFVYPVLSETVTR